MRAFSMKTIFRALRQRASGMRRRVRRVLLGEQHARREVFRDIYARKSWGSDDSAPFFSGVGSRGEAAAVYVEAMSALLAEQRVTTGRPITIIDLGCGDFQIGKALVSRMPDMIYIGCDIVPELVVHNQATYGDDRVSFRRIDIVADPLPKGDVCLVRQVLQHLSNADIARFLTSLDYPCVYVTEGQPETQSGPVNPDKTAGADVRFDWHRGIGRGLELDRPPFNLNVKEVFRAAIPGHEIIVTQRVA